MKTTLGLLVLASILPASSLQAMAAARPGSSPKGPKGASAVPAAGPAAFKALKPGQEASGFKAASLYLNHLGRPMGARFVHGATGLALDILFFASVPQVSLVLRTLPDDDKGIPHALEHLVLGKGARGKHYGMLMDMSLGEHTAGTYTDVTAYKFNVAAGMEDFYRVLEASLASLAAPDFTDEEVRREVYNPEVVEDPAAKRLAIEEKGTVYNEMVSSMEKAGSNNWHQFLSLSYGAGHPLARNAGGLPDEMRSATVEELRGFHARHYRVGPGMGLVAALPRDEDPFAFLARFAGILERVTAGAGEPAGTAPGSLPPFAPSPDGGTAIGRYPSTDLGAPQGVVLGWRPLPDLSLSDAIELGVLLDLLGGGETSYLHRDLVDRQTRKRDFGVSAVEAFLLDPPETMPGLSFDGVPVDMVDEARLGDLRDAVSARVAWLAGLKRGSRDLREAAAKAKSLVSARRRQMLKFMDSPPRFGARSGGIAWHRHLEWLNASERGFAKSVPQNEAFDRLLAKLESGENVWAGIAARGGLLASPRLSAVLPDAGLLERQKEEKAARIAKLEAETLVIHGERTVQAALMKMKFQSDRLALALEERDRKVERPHFVKQPPLTLDDKLEVERRDLAGVGAAVMSSVGESPFTDIGLFFDLSGVGPGDFVFLPLLADSLTGVGVRTPGGVLLDYAAMIERYRREIYALSSDVAANPHTGRLELSLSAAASSRAELAKAVEWLDNCLRRGALGPGSRSRLLDMAREDTQSLRTIMQRREEHWVRDAAAAYAYQDQPAWMSIRSPFTRLHHLDRLRWMLEDPPPRDLAAWRGLLAGVEKLASGDASRERVLEAVGGLPAEMAEQLKWELGYLPEESWRGDLAGLARGIAGDLGVGSKAAIERLADLRRRVLRRGKIRVCLTGNKASLVEAARLVRAAAAHLPPAAGPAGRPAGEAVTTGRRLVVLERLAGRLPGLKGAAAPVHVGLVNNATKSGVFVLSAKGPSYRDATDEAATDFLAANLLGGSSPYGLFMKTWAAGLAYSNGVGASLANGLLRYYAERCPSLARTMSFAVKTASDTALDDPFYVEYALASSFGDYRGADDFTTRGYSMGANLADGVTPEVVRAFKTRLVAKAAEPGIVRAAGARLAPVLGRLLVGLGPKVSDAPGATAFVIGPEPLLAEYEQYLREEGEGGGLVRLYPRDFWIP